MSKFGAEECFQLSKWKTLKNPAMEQNDSLVVMPGSQRKGTTISMGTTMPCRKPRG